MTTQRRERDGEAGFTLLELMVALVVTSLVVGALTGGLGLGRRAWHASKLDEAKGEVEAASRALSDVLAQAWPAIAPDERKALALVFRGRPRDCSFVALSEGDAQFGGLVAVDIGLAGDASGKLNLWTAVYRAADAFTRDRGKMVRADVLAGVEQVEFAYFGKSALDQPPQWRGDWIGMPLLPQAIKVKLRARRGGRLYDGSFVAALPQGTH